MNRHFDCRTATRIITVLFLLFISVARTIPSSVGMDSNGDHFYRPLREFLILIAYSWNVGGSSGGSISVAFRNMGTNDIDLHDTNLYINGLLAPSALNSCSYVLVQGQTCSVTAIPVPGTGYSIGLTYNMKLVTPDGRVFPYQIVCGRSW